jgi:hypothetical protein
LAINFSAKTIRATPATSPHALQKGIAVCILCALVLAGVAQSKKRSLEEAVATDAPLEERFLNNMAAVDPALKPVLTGSLCFQNLVRNAAKQ